MASFFVFTFIFWALSLLFAFVFLIRPDFIFRRSRKLKESSLFAERERPLKEQLMIFALLFLAAFCLGSVAWHIGYFSSSLVFR